MEDQKRKNYLVYFKLGVVDAVVNNKADNSYMKSSAYYKKGFEKGLKETVNWFGNPGNLTHYKSDLYNL